MWLKNEFITLNELVNLTDSKHKTINDRICF